MATRTIKVINLSAKATERDINEFFSFSGEIEHIDVQSDMEGSKIAFITFKNPEAIETAILLSGATILDQVVTITEVDDYHSSPHETAKLNVSQSAGSPHVMEAVTKAQDMISTMLSKGYVLGKDAMNQAKIFDEKHQLTANVTATVSSIDRKMRISNKFSSGTAAINGHVKAIDEKYHVAEKTRSAFVAAEEKINNAGSALMKNKYIFTSAAWVTDAFNKVSKAAEEASQKALEKVHVSGPKQDPVSSQDSS